MLRTANTVAPSFASRQKGRPDALVLTGDLQKRRQSGLITAMRDVCIFGFFKVAKGCALTCALLLSSVLAQSAESEPARHGLLWNRTGLPAVFPLQVRTAAGAEFFMLLSDADTGVPALAGYIKGGRFFKVLVPPGVYTVEFATGPVWQDEQALFGIDSTTMIELPEALGFGVVGLSTKAGHMVDLRQWETDILVQDSFDCQRIRLAKGPRPLPAYDPEATGIGEIKPRRDVIEYPYRAGPARRVERQDKPPIATDYAPYFSRPEYEVRRSPC